MKVDIITPDKKLYSGEANLVQVPGTQGSFEILKNHAPIISTLKTGQVKLIDPNKQTVLFDIKSGVIEVLNNTITILALL